MVCCLKPKKNFRVLCDEESKTGSGTELHARPTAEVARFQGRYLLLTLSRVIFHLVSRGLPEDRGVIESSCKIHKKKHLDRDRLEVLRSYQHRIPEFHSAKCSTWIVENLDEGNDFQEGTNILQCEII
jgi:hypothetical protein